MLDRRGFMLNSAGFAALAAAGMASPADPEMESLHAVLAQTVGDRAKAAGMVAVFVDANGTRTATFGNSGVPGLAMNGDAVFEIMSITKVLTALLLADMAQRGEVAFDDPVAKYLPVPLHEQGGPIRLIDLATYTSGLPNMPGNLPPDWYARAEPMRNYTQADLFAFLADYMPKHKPGTHYEYANLGFGLLGVALARRAGKPYEALLIERICRPLGLDHTRLTLTADMRQHVVQGHGLDMAPTSLWEWPAMPGAGYARSTARDLALFVRANLGFVRSPLPVARLLEIRRPTSLAGTQAGLGWYITTDQGEQIVWKSGLSTGCNTFIGFSPQRRCGVVLLSNFLWQPLDAGTITMGIKMIKPDFQPVNFSALYPLG